MLLFWTSSKGHEYYWEQDLEVAYAFAYFRSRIVEGRRMGEALSLPVGSLHMHAIASFRRHSLCRTSQSFAPTRVPDLAFSFFATLYKLSGNKCHDPPSHDPF